MKPKYKAQRTFSVAKDGFFGEYYPAAGEKFKGKSLIIFGGSAGLFLLTQVLAGSLMPDLISCVVSVAPLEMVSQAEGENDKHLANGSAFSWHGESLPYMKYVPSDPKEWSRKYLRDSWKHKEPWSKDILIDSYAANENPEAVIKIWNIKGPILLQGSVNDSMCPDEETISRMEKQLSDHNFAYPVETHIYPHISHLILPLKPYSTKLFRAERKDPKGCARDRIDSWSDTLKFLEDKWV